MVELIDLEKPRQELDKVYTDLDSQIASLGFRRATVQGALIEVDRLLGMLRAETNGHTG